MAPILKAPVTLRETYSFYVPGSQPDRIQACAEHGDAVVVAGKAGPKSVVALRSSGWNKVVLFDQAGYLSTEPRIDPPLKWFEEQQNAGADRILTPGVWIGVQKGSLPFGAQIESEVALAEKHNATCLMALDHHWLTKSAKFDEMFRSLKELKLPVALVFGDRSDPLGYPGAVNSLVALTSQLESLSILRCDHGALGALAFGASHASMGLATTYRHAVPPGVQSRCIPHDLSPRIFVRELMDWFTASTIGGWSTRRITSQCDLACCSGQHIERFLDDRLKSDADLHNRSVLSAIAEVILDIPDPVDRRRAFGRMCSEAIEQYGIMGGLTSRIKPKTQLEQWALLY